MTSAEKFALRCLENDDNISSYSRAIELLGKLIHELNKKWWIDLETNLPKERNFGELIALMHSELSEALEGHRKNLMDDKLPHRKMVEVELADCIIRILDTAYALKLDIGGALVEKCFYNAHREDHQLESRKQEHGKKY